MNLQITGKITEINPPEKKSDRFTLFQYWLEYQDGEYTNSAAFQCNEKTYEYVRKKHLGDEATVTFKPDSRKVNGHTFTSLKTIRFE